MKLFSFKVGTVGGNLALKNLHNEFPSDVFLLMETVGAVVTLSRYLTDLFTKVETYKN